jgi:hypothetical protein
MKKILLFASAMLISMVSMAASIDFSAQGYENAQVIESVTIEEGLVVTFDKGTNQNAPMYYNSGTAVRVYGGGTMTVTATGNTISKIVLTYGTGDNTNEITTDCGTFATDTWTGSASSVTFTVGGTSKHRRIKVIEVTLGEGGSTPETPETPETPDEPGTEEPETPVEPEGAITCAEAVTICEKTGSTLTAETYTIRGYVTEIKYTWSEKYGTATFWIADTKDGGQVLQAYSCAPLTDADKVFAVGDYVELVGKLKKYNTTNEVEKGTYTVITAADGGETPEEPEEPETPVEPGETTIEIPAEAAAWDIPAEAIDVLQARAICAALQPGQNTGKKYYVMGYVKRLSSKHAEAVEKYKNARFYMENVKGGNSDEEFVAFQVKGIDGGDITNPDVVAAGDFVIVYGELTHFKYDANSDSDYETVGGGKAYIWKSTNPLLADTESGVEDVIVNEKMTKVIKNGKMYIIRDGKAYNVLGAQL